MHRLASDEDFNGRVVTALRRRDPRLDLQRVQDAGLAGAPDPTLLAWAAGHGRVLLTHDRRTMPRYAYDRVIAGLPMPGLLVVRNDDCAFPAFTTTNPSRCQFWRAFSVPHLPFNATSPRLGFRKATLDSPSLYQRARFDCTRHRGARPRGPMIELKASIAIWRNRMAATGLVPVGPRLAAWPSVVAPLGRAQWRRQSFDGRELAVSHGSTRTSPVVSKLQIAHGHVAGASEMCAAESRTPI